MKSLSLHFKSKIAFIALSLFILCNALISIYYISASTSRIDTNLLALFPKNAFSTLDDSITDTFVKRLDKQVLFLVKDNGDNEGKTGKYFLQRLNDLNAFDKINGLMDNKAQKAYGEFFFKYKLSLIDKNIINMLESYSPNKDESKLINFIQTQLYNGFAGLGSKEILNDPYLLTRSKQMDLLSKTQKISIKNDLLSVSDEKDTWYFIFASLKDSGLDVKRSDNIVNSINLIEKDLKAKFSNTKLLRRGSVFYNDDATKKAQHDIKKLATLSLILMLALMLFAFKSIMPIIFTIGSVLIGALVGLSITTTLFSSIHLITVLISISIIGIAADYSIFYLSYAYNYGFKIFKEKYYNLIKKSVFTALITSALAYILMLVAPFPIILQISALAISGLTTTALVVLIIYPYLNRFYKKPKVIHTSLFKFAKINNKYLCTIALLCFVFCAYYLPKSTIDHDISKLQALSSDLKKQDDLINKLTKQNLEQKFILVQGDDANTALKGAKQIYSVLDLGIKQNILERYQALLINTLEEQKHAKDLINKNFNRVQSFYSDLGIEISNVYKDSPFLLVEDYFSSPISQGFDLLFIKTEKKSYIMIPLTNIHDIKALKESLKEYKFAYFIDRKEAFDDLFASCSNILFIILALSFIAIAISHFLRQRFNIKETLLAFTPSLLSVAMPFALLACFNMPLNMFAILASLLVLGISVNYVSFIKTLASNTNYLAIFAVSMAMLTTIITLGVLVFSSTYAVALFGIVLTTGIITAYILCPLASFTSKKEI